MLSAAGRGDGGRGKGGQKLGAGSGRAASFLPRGCPPPLRARAPLLCEHRAQRPPVPEPRRLMGRNGVRAHEAAPLGGPRDRRREPGRRLGLGPGALFTSQEQARPLLEEGGPHPSLGAPRVVGAAALERLLAPRHCETGVRPRRVRASGPPALRVHLLCPAGDSGAALRRPLQDPPPSLLPDQAGGGGAKPDLRFGGVTQPGCSYWGLSPVKSARPCDSSGQDQCTRAWGAALTWPASRCWWWAQPLPGPSQVCPGSIAPKVLCSFPFRARVLPLVKNCSQAVLTSHCQDVEASRASEGLGPAGG